MKAQYFSSKPPDGKETQPSQEVKPQVAAGKDAPAAQPDYTVNLSNTAQIGAYKCYESGNGHENGNGNGKTRILNLSSEQWEKEKEEHKNRAWKTTPEGRLGVRMFSRGVLGAIGFAAANRLATNALSRANFNPERLNLSSGPIHHRAVRAVAHFFDFAAGKPIKFIADSLGFDGKRAVTFRPTRKFYFSENNPGQDGRSLGHEVVAVTLDFAMMGVGDAIGRDLADIVDPNYKLSWKHKDGSIDYNQAFKSAGMSVFRYLTYNQGEDWAVGLPYVYFIRAQRNLINKFSPGFGYDSDRGLNGGSFKINDKSHIVGNYNIEGIFDLQSRFTVYNILTLLFRETYVEAADKLMKWQDTNYAMPKFEFTKSVPETLADNAAHIAKWAVRDVIKGGIYMTPAVPFFWMTRTPQTKARGIMIHPEKGIVSYQKQGAMYPDAVHINEPSRDSNDRARKSIPPKPHFNPETPVFFSSFDHKARDKPGYKGDSWSYGEPAVNPFGNGYLDLDKGSANGFKYSFGMVDGIINSFGKVNNAVRRSFHRPVRWAGSTFNFDHREYGVKRWMDSFVNASLSYTPYFYTKAEFAKMWDHGKMDLALERMIDGVAHFNAGEFDAGAHEVLNTLMFRPLPDPKREAEGNHRKKTDISAADVFDPKLFKMSRNTRALDAMLHERCLDPEEEEKKMRFAEQIERKREEARKNISVLREPAAPRMTGFAKQYLNEQQITQGYPDAYSRLN